jgi:polysaccharide pyruvyl transferase CsaB
LPGKLLLGGYIGAGNQGDDAIMLGLVHGLADAPYDVSVLSGAPQETHRLYGFASIPRRDQKLVDQAIDECDALVFPGGSIFQDATSVGSVYYYTDLVKTAKKKGKKVMLLGQGVGPLDSFFGRRLAASAFNMADVVTVRDPASLDTLKEIGVRRNVPVTADCAFLLPQPSESPEGGFNVGNMTTVGVAPRPLKEKGKDVIGLTAEFCRLLYQSGSMPVLIEMDRNEDGPLIQEISKRQGGKIPDLRKVQTPMQMQQRLARMDSIVAMRLHAGILAATVNVPPLMVSYDPKVTAFAKVLQLAPAMDIEGLTAPRLLESFRAFSQDNERNRKVLAKRREDLRDMAMRNVELLRNLIP